MNFLKGQISIASLIGVATVIMIPFFGYFTYFDRTIDNKNNELRNVVSQKAIELGVIQQKTIDLDERLKRIENKLDTIISKLK